MTSRKAKAADTKADGKSALVPKLRFPEFRDAGGWKTAKLAALSSTGLSNGVFNDPKKVGTGYKLINVSEMYIETTIVESHLSLLDISRAEFLANQVVDGDIFFTRSSLVKSGIAASNIYLGSARDITFDGHLIRFRPDRSQILPKFTHYLLKSEPIRNQLISRGKSATMTTIGQADVAATSVSIPPSTGEQQKIAECLSSVDELIAAQARKLVALKTHKRGLMQQLFTREGETQPRLRFPEFQNAGEWAVQRLDELAHYENGKAHENDISENGRYVVVNSKFISTEGEVSKFSNEGFCVAHEGNVLMVLSDVPNGRAIAKCFFVESDDRYTVNQRICRIQPTKVNGRFLFYILDRNTYFLDFDDGIKQTNLRKEDVLGCPLCVPPRPDEQQRIADCLTSLDDLIAAQTQKLEALKTHKKGLMQQLFPSPDEVEA